MTFEHNGHRIQGWLVSSSHLCEHLCLLWEPAVLPLNPTSLLFNRSLPMGTTMYTWDKFPGETQKKLKWKAGKHGKNLKKKLTETRFCAIRLQFHPSSFPAPTNFQSASKIILIHSCSFNNSLKAPPIPSFRLSSSSSFREVPSLFLKRNSQTPSPFYPCPKIMKT